MLHIAAIEIHAAGRHELVRKLNALIEAAGSSPHLIPPISIRPVAPEEAAFLHAPEVVIAGPVLCEESPDSLRRFRSLFPEAYLIGMLADHTDQLGRAEALASRGVDELMSVSIAAVQFLQRLIVLNRSLASSRRGKLILVDGAKGGVGATSIAAGIGEMLATLGHSTALVDLDSDTQDLSRFLGARPYLNDTLQMILNQQSPLTKENMAQSLVQVGDEAAPFSLVPPVMTPYATLSPMTPAGKSFLAFLQMIDSEYNYTIIDLAHAGPDLRLSLLRGADKVVVVVNGAPSTLHGAAQKITTMKAIHGDFSRLHIIENISPHSLPSSLMRSEITKMTGMPREGWIESAIPYSRPVAYWPGSFSTPASIGCRRTRRALLAATAALSESSTGTDRRASSQSFQRISDILAMTKRAISSSRDAASVPALSYSPSTETKRLPSPEANAPRSRNQSIAKQTI